MPNSDRSTDTESLSPPRSNGLLGKFMRRLATPLTTGLFAVSTVSGIALFFHWLPSMFHSMHVWLSMVLLLPFAFHVWRNWRPLIGYARRGTLLIPFALSVVAAIPFAISGVNGASRRGDNPAFRTLALMTQARLTDLAPVLRTTPASLLATLQKHGYSAHSTDDTLSAVAASSGKDANEALADVLPSGERRGRMGRESP